AIYALFVLCGPVLGKVHRITAEEPRYLRFILARHLNGNDFAQSKPDEPHVETDIGNTDKKPEFFIDSLLNLSRDASIPYNLKYRIKDPEGHFYTRRENSDGAGLIKGYVKFVDEKGFPKSVHYALRIKDHTTPPTSPSLILPDPKPLEAPWVYNPENVPTMVESAVKYSNENSENLKRPFKTVISRALPKLVTARMDNEGNRFKIERTIFPVFNVPSIPGDHSDPIDVTDDSHPMHAEQSRGVFLNLAPEMENKILEESTHLMNKLFEENQNISNNMIEGSSDGARDHEEESSEVAHHESEESSEVTNNQLEGGAEDANNRNEGSSEEINHHSEESSEEISPSRKEKATASHVTNNALADVLSFAEQEFAAIARALFSKESKGLQSLNGFSYHNNYVKDYEGEDEKSLHSIPSRSTIKLNKRSMDLHGKKSAQFAYDDPLQEYVLTHRRFANDDEEPLYITQTKPRVHISYHSQAFNEKKNDRREPTFIWP
ncbi:hypothetical protein NPIL_109381, partial [Nephila pilipes]